LLIWSALAAIVVTCAVALWEWVEHEHRLSYIPGALGVTKVLYAHEESWGFGPGGNETGVIAYELPPDVALRIELEGKQFLEKLPVAPYTGDWRGRYETWALTPIDGHKEWLEGELSRYGPPGAVIRPQLENYLNKYGFGIDVDPAVLRQVNVAVSTPGSLFAYGRIGVIILVPKEQAVFYVYNG